MSAAESYALNSMDIHATHHAGSDDDQEESLLRDGQDMHDTSRPKRVYQNSDKTLILLGSTGSVVIIGLIFALIWSLFGASAVILPINEVLPIPKFGKIGCVYPGEVISPMLEQNLTLLEDTLTIVTSGRAIGDIHFHTEPEDLLEYVRLDVKLQGPVQSDLYNVYTRVREGRYELQTPETLQGCLRFTLEVWLPKRLVSLTVKAETLTHMSFADIDLDSSIHDLDLKIGGDASDNLLLLPEARIQNAEYAINSGFVIGTTLLYNTLTMNSGLAQTDVEIVAMEDEKSMDTEAHNLDLKSATKGLSRTKLRNPEGYALHAHHEGSDTTTMALSYPKSFAGEWSMSTHHLTVWEAAPGVDIAADGAVYYLGARDAPQSDVRIRNDLGSVWLSFDQ